MSRKKPISRRTVLKGLGATLGLPLLDIMSSPAWAGSQKVAKPPVRMGFVFFPNGSIIPDWKPQGDGKNFRFSKTLKPLEKVRNEINIISGLAQENGRANGDGAGDHARCAGSFLTGAHPYKTAGANIRLGVSVDQVAASRIGHLTRLPSLELGIERGRNAGSCDSGYSCAYSSNIAWKSPTTPVAKEIHPRLAFERLFGTNDSKKVAQKRNLRRQSILDLVADDARKIRSRLGKNDRQKIAEYFESIHEIEMRLSKPETKTLKKRPDLKVPSGIPGDLTEHIRLMFDLMAVAFQTDNTRIATFMLANAGSNRSYPMVNVNEGHHSISHHRNQREKIEKLQRIDHYLVSQFAYFVKKLQSIPEGEGTLLDNCMMLYGSGLSDGNRHWHHELPVVLAGKAGGRIRSGSHRIYPSETPMNNLFLSMLDLMGANVEKLGDSSGRLSGLVG